MRASVRLLLPVLGVAAVLSAATASADPICTGTAEDGYVCVEPDNAPGVVSRPGTFVGRCVLLPTETSCRNIGATVPGAGVDGGSPGNIVYCSGNCGTTVVNFVTGAAEPATNIADVVVEFGTEFAGEVQDEHRWCAGGGVPTSGPRLLSYAECMTN